MGGLWLRVYPVLHENLQVKGSVSGFVGVIVEQSMLHKVLFYRQGIVIPVVASQKVLKARCLRIPQDYSEKMQNPRKTGRFLRKIPRFTYLHDLPVLEKSDKEIYRVWNGIQQRVGITTAYLDCTTTDNFKDFEFFLVWYRNQHGSNLN